MAKGTGRNSGSIKQPTVHPITSPKLKSLASKATRAPSTLTTKETQELGASVMRHIEPRGGKID